MNDTTPSEDVASLREKAGFFDTLLSASAEGIAITDNVKKFVQVNSMFGEVFGQQPAELIGTKLPEWLAALDETVPRQWAELERRVHAHGSCRGFELQIPTNTAPRHFRINALLSKQTDRHPPGGIVSAWRDDTQRMQAEQTRRDTERTFHAIFNHTFQFTG